jgi:hypothetical protein
VTEELIGQLGYMGIALILVLGGLGLPVPEEAPIILAAMLSRTGRMRWELALTACFVGVLLGDFIVYFIGYFYGEKVLSLPMTRKFLTREREVQIKGYFHRHGFKILILGRFRRRLPDRRLSDRRHLAAAGPQALPHRPARGDFEHVADVRARLHLRGPDPVQL